MENPRVICVRASSQGLAGVEVLFSSLSILVELAGALGLADLGSQVSGA